MGSNTGISVFKWHIKLYYIVWQSEEASWINKKKLLRFILMILHNTY